MAGLAGSPPLGLCISLKGPFSIAMSGDCEWRFLPCVLVLKKGATLETLWLCCCFQQRWNRRAIVSFVLIASQN